MADIKQAAAWLKEGREVRRSVMGEMGGFHITPGGFVEFRDSGFSASLHLYDLLADDWEVV